MNDPREPPEIEPSCGDVLAGVPVELERPEVLARLRALADDPADGTDAGRAEIERVLSDGAALVLTLERSLLGLKRRRRAVQPRTMLDPEAVAEALALDAERERVADDIRELRLLLLTVRRRFAAAPGGLARGNRGAGS